MSEWTLLASEGECVQIFHQARVKLEIFIAVEYEGDQ